MKVKTGKTGVTENTPKNILFGAGTIHKGLKYNDSSKSWNFDESIIGATKGGSKFRVKPEVYQIEPDGATVAVMEMNVKNGEVAEMDLNFLEITEDIIKASVFGEDGTSPDALYSLIESKERIEAGDYLENIAYVGETLDGRNIIVIMDNALCTSGLESGGENKKESVIPYTFACNAALDSGMKTLPYHIYYPKPKA